MLPVVRPDLAESDLVAILEYLDERSPPAAERLASAIDARCSLLGQLPEMGRKRDDLFPGLRSIVVEHHVIFYRITATAVEIVRILFGSRDIDSIMKMENPS